MTFTRQSLLLIMIVLSALCVVPMHAMDRSSDGGAVRSAGKHVKECAQNYLAVMGTYAGGGCLYYGGSQANIPVTVLGILMISAGAYVIASTVLKWVDHKDSISSADPV